jgi:hypothetical protein
MAKAIFHVARAERGAATARASDRARGTAAKALRRLNPLFERGMGYMCHRELSPFFAFWTLPRSPENVFGRAQFPVASVFTRLRHVCDKPSVARGGSTIKGFLGNFGIFDKYFWEKEFFLQQRP